MENEEQYEERFIAFIDILGFRNHIERSVNEASHFETIKKVLGEILERKVTNDKGFPIGKEISVFSDSIVISYPYSVASAGFYLLLDVIHLQLQMLYSEILMRGGITIGLLYHKNNIVFGPAMNSAYDLENSHAIVPRVLVDNNVIEAAVSNGTHGSEEEREYVEDLISTDEDGRLFVDFMSQWQEIDSNEEYLSLMESSKKFIEHSVNVNAQNERLLPKYIWLRDYYNKTISRLNPRYTEGLFIEEEVEQ